MASKKHNGARGDTRRRVKEFGGVLMRILLKVTEFVGFMLLALGGGAIDSAPVLGLVVAIGGLGIAISGFSVEGLVYDD